MTSIDVTENSYLLPEKTNYHSTLTNSLSSTISEDSVTNYCVVNDNNNNLSTVEKREVFFTFHFVKISEIDTKAQQFKADVLIYARWYEPELNGKEYLKDKAFTGSLWNPQLRVYNLESKLQDDIYYNIEVNQSGVPYVHYTRHLYGVFYEKMELWEFPFDVQDLSITVSSDLRDDEVILREDPETLCSVSSEGFQDIQSWCLYDHVEVVRAFPDPLENLNFHSPIISATSRVSRNPVFYIWNNYFIMMCLLCLSLCIFAIDRTEVKYRISTQLTLLLTTVASKLSTAGQLPLIPYFTLLDVYICSVLLYQIMLLFFVSAISTGYFTELDAIYFNDKISFVGCLTVLFLFHVIYITYCYCKTYRRRRQMFDKEYEYTGKKMVRRVKKRLSKVLSKIDLHNTPVYHRSC